MPPALRSRAVLGLDLGASSATGAAFDLSGRCLAAEESAYRHAAPHAGWAEADAEAWWRATGDVLRRIAAAVGRDNVEAVAVTGPAPTLLAVDAQGQPLRPAILSVDARSVGEVAPMAARLPEAERIGGNRLHAQSLGPKLAWLQRHEPEAYGAAAAVLQSHSYPVLRLTGRAVTDHSSAALCAPLYDVRRRRWSEDACDRLAVAPSLLPEIAAAHAMAGRITASAARDTGLHEGTPVVVGGADLAASTLAAGVTEPGEACLTIDARGTLVMPFTDGAFDTRLINGHHVGCDRYLAVGATLAGAVLDWFRDAMAPGVSLDALDAEAGAVPAGAGGVTLVPYLSGERTPIWDPSARGAFLGLSLAHGRGHLYRAVLEGVAVSFRHCLEVAREHGLALREVIAVGGGARSALWRQILCDALGAPLLYVPDNAGAPAGAAMLAALGTGGLPDVHAAKAWRGHMLEHRPDPAGTEIYAGLLAERVRRYPALRAIA